MATIPELTEDLDILQKLDDVPALPYKEMQAKFDASGNIIKNYLNEVVVQAINSMILITGDVDRTLTIDGAPADAFTVGSRLSSIISSMAGKLSLSGGTMTGKITGIVTPTSKKDAANKEYVDGVRKIFHNITVRAIDFRADSTYTAFPYKAEIPLTGVLATMVPEVVFPIVDFGYAPVCSSFNGGVSIWVSERPNEDFVIPTIICFRGDSE